MGNHRVIHDAIRCLFCHGRSPLRSLVVRSVAAFGTSLKIRRRFAALFWHEGGVLALELLRYASAPALGHGLGRGIGEDILFPFLQPIEDAQRRGLWRRLRYLEA